MDLTLGSYQMKERIGAGGMGEVYRAWDSRLKRDVAIKVLPDLFAKDADRISRFRREAEMLASLNHPHIAAIYDLQQLGDSYCLVLELVQGETLSQRLSRSPLSVDETVAIAVQIAGALQAAHEKGIVHRDIKPGNIMVTGQRHVKILDFGLARQSGAVLTEEAVTVNSLTETGVIAGTPQYMSPEVLQGAAADERTDLWAFGVVLYQMLTGQLPFRGTTLFEISSSILKDQAAPLPAGLPQQLREVVSRCLAKSPGQRYSSAAEIRTALEHLQQAPRVNVRRRASVWIAAAAVLVTISGVVAWQQTRTTPVGLLTSTGSPSSPNREARDQFELSANISKVQNNIPQALEALDRALILDPKFSEARRARAFYRVIYLLNGYSNDTSQLYLAEQELRQVETEAPDLINLPPTQAAVYVTLGRKELVSIEKLERSVRESPAQAPMIWRGVLHLLAGEDQQAKDVFLRLLEKDPIAGPPRQLFGEVLRSEGDTQEAIRAEKRVLQQAPTNISAIWVLSTAYLDEGNTAAARALLEESRSMFSENYLWKISRALLLAAEGKHEEARKAMDEETRKFADAIFWGTTPVAEFYAILGENSTALEWLRKAVRNGDERIDYFRRNPRFASLRSDPRFQSIISNVEARRASQR